MNYRPPFIHPVDLTGGLRFFGPDLRQAVDVSLALVDWQCVLNDKREMEGTFLDFLLRHVVYRAKESVRNQYCHTHNWLSATLQNYLADAEKDWDDVVNYLSRSFRTSNLSANTLIVPYHDRGHWSVFVLEKSRTYHADPAHQFHKGLEVDNFLFLVHMGWATAKGVKVGSPEWRQWQSRKPIRLPLPNQREAWECGFVACLGFWQYLIGRGERVEAEQDAVTRMQYLDWEGTKAHRWFMQALYTEIVEPLPLYDPPNLSAQGTVEFGSASPDVVFVEGSGKPKKKVVQPLGVLGTVGARQLEDFNVLRNPPLHLRRRKTTTGREGAEKPKGQKPEKGAKAAKAGKGATRRRG